jgi:hypothetical protein
LNCWTCFFLCIKWLHFWTFEHPPRIPRTFHNINWISRKHPGRCRKIGDEETCQGSFELIIILK